MAAETVQFFLRILTQAVERWETLKPGLRDADKVSLFETQKVVYEHLQRGLVESDRPEEALLIAERGRARAFTELAGQVGDPQRLRYWTGEDYGRWSDGAVAIVYGSGCTFAGGLALAYGG